jgi:hypothetical protein
MSPKLWQWWLGISYASIALVVFILAKKSYLGEVAFDCIQGALLSLIWLPMVLLSPISLLLALGDKFTHLIKEKWAKSPIGQTLDRWWLSNR